MSLLDAGDLRTLEQLVREALSTGDESRLDVIGYGEITSVLRWPRGDKARACKRLPRFPDTGSVQQFATTFERYVAALRRARVDVVDTELHTIENDDGSVTAYLVQPLLHAETLGPHVLASADHSRSHPMFDAIADAVAAVCTPEVGIDAQVSNWSWDGERLRYFDVTTPFLHTPSGEFALDLRVFLASTPAFMRPVLRRWVMPGIEARYHDARFVYLDLAGNLCKERLERWIPAWLATANERPVATGGTSVSGSADAPITEREVRKFYAGDARLWRFMQWVRRADRRWQRGVRRRPYQVLLPGPIAR